MGDDARWVYVSMKSGLEGRNNFHLQLDVWSSFQWVSMKSGLEGRNNHAYREGYAEFGLVSMKSGLEGRNNLFDLNILCEPYWLSQ